MKVRFLESIAGELFNYTQGEVVDLDLDKKEIARWIKSGICEAVVASKKKETATAEPDIERATTNTGRKTRKVKK